MVSNASNRLLFGETLSCDPFARKSFITLKVGDNGKGFPGHINYKDTNSLGMQLIMALTNQLDGEISMQPNKEAGTLFIIRFHHHKK